MDKSKTVPSIIIPDSVISSNSLYSLMQNHSFVAMLLLVATAIVFFIWKLMKRTKKLELETKNSQKINNDVTNLKYGLQDTVAAVQDLRNKFLVPTRDSSQKSSKKSSKPSPVKVPEPVPKIVHFAEPQDLSGATARFEIESVNSDDVEGENEIIELEEGSESELDSESEHESELESSSSSSDDELDEN
jgi:hypothetical protein